MKKYTNKECSLIQSIYPIENKDSILKKIPNRTWDAIRQQAKKMRIKRIADERKDKKTTNLRKLLDGSNISFYWIGFLLADGNFRNGKAIRCELSAKDKTHLEKLTQYLNTPIRFNAKRNTVDFEAYDCDFVPKIMEFVGLDCKKVKTYTCPDINKLEKLNDLNAFAMLIGFIDGDGYIRNKNNKTALIISNHVSWTPFYNFMISKFKRFSDKSLPNWSITKYGYIRWCCGQKEFLQNLKIETENLKLSCMERKWNEIKL